MDFNNIQNMSFAKIKEEVSQINIDKEYNSEEFLKLIEILKSDKRKNVNSLGDRLLKSKNKIIEEIKRVKKLYEFEEGFGNHKYVAGVDEVGRGPLAGPIVAAAVILNHESLDENIILGLNDSKKISEKNREELAEIIKEKAVAYKISLCTNEEIDKYGIGYCNNKVFLDSVNNLSVKPELVLSDGYPIKNITFPNKAVVKGDTKAASIAAASIIAKVYRDNLMKEYSFKYKGYHFDSNVGYGSTEHIEAIHEKGICSIHRKSFLTKILEK